MKRFVILAAPRTGSNMLCTLLQSHPDVLCHHEVFNPQGIYYALPLRKAEPNPVFNLGSMAERDADPQGFLERLWGQALGHSHVGFKMTHPQQPQIVDTLCGDPDVYKIVLKRKARLKTYVSSLIAQRSGVWEDYSKPAEERATNAPVHVEYQALKKAIQVNDQYYSHLDATIRGPRIDLDYEALLEDATQHKLLTALRLRVIPLSTKSRQQNPQPTRVLIKNAKSLRQQIKADPAPGNQDLLNELQGD